MLEICLSYLLFSLFHTIHLVFKLVQQCLFHSLVLIFLVKLGNYQLMDISFEKRVIEENIDDKLFVKMVCLKLGMQFLGRFSLTFLKLLLWFMLLLCFRGLGVYLFRLVPEDIVLLNCAVEQFLYLELLPELIL